MVVKRQCSFCAGEIEPGTGSMFVKRDGSVFHFCSASCRKQQLHLGRVGHRFKWTRAHALKRAADMRSTAAPASSAARTGKSAVPKALRSPVQSPKPADNATESAAPAGPEKGASKPAAPVDEKAAPKASSAAKKPRSKPAKSAGADSDSGGGSA